MSTQTTPTYRRQSEVVELTSLSRITLWRMAQRGEFPKPVQLSPRRVGYSAAAVDAWLAERAQSSTSEDARA